MCRIKNKSQNEQFKSSRKNKKIVDESIIEEITLMIKRFIDEAESSFLINSVNDHITRKILDSRTTDHIFCNRLNFISYILKIFICETDTRKNFTAKNIESIQMKFIDDQNRSKLMILIEVLYSFQLRYNLISIIKLDKKEVETLLSLLIKTFKLWMNDNVITLANIINSQYVLRENFTNESRALAKLEDLEIWIWHAWMKHLKYDNLLKLQNQIHEMNLINHEFDEICESCMINRQKRNVNKTFCISISKFLQIVHFDLEKSLSRTRSSLVYYIIFRDDWSDVIWVHLLRNKN
jgi:hypothetical protein